MKIVVIGAGVGGFPQRSLWAGWSPQIDRGLWLVGDSVFPGQSTAGVTLGALRVAREIERSVPLADRQTNLWGVMIEYCQEINRLN